MAKPHDRNRLTTLDGFGSNPGELRAAFYAPPHLAKGCPLVVVLHGIGQDAETYNHGAGWSMLADQCGFALLFPELRKASRSPRQRWGIAREEWAGMSSF